MYAEDSSTTPIHHTVVIQNGGVQYSILTYLGVPPIAKVIDHYLGMSRTGKLFNYIL